MGSQLAQRAEHPCGAPHSLSATTTRDPRARAPGARHANRRPIRTRGLGARWPRRWLHRAPLRQASVARCPSNGLRPTRQQRQGEGQLLSGAPARTPGTLTLASPLSTPAGFPEPGGSVTAARCASSGRESGTGCKLGAGRRSRATSTRSRWWLLRGPRRPEQGTPGAAPQRGQPNVLVTSRVGWR